ncbi:uncharacterized protein LOC143623328 [Bidens hawaiensis]|uniref:uncharacterized protein LOC143623328 n=1 Tax=Bidens hawaiensis TaxID=980011 RepID=UPI00404B150D
MGQLVLQYFKTIYIVLNHFHPFITSSQPNTSSVFAPVVSTASNVNPGPPPIPKKNTQPRGDLPTYSGTSTWVDLVISNSDILSLMKQFSCCRSFEKMTSDLYIVVQNNNESLRNYITRFSREALDIPNLDMAAAVEALKMGLKKDSPFYVNLVMTPCRNVDDVRNRALRYIRLEDDKKAHGNLIIPKYESTKRKSDSPQTFSRPKPYSKQNSSRINAVEGDEDDEKYPRLSKYFFKIDISGVICSMQDLGDKARWPKKNEKSGSEKDKSKWILIDNGRSVNIIQLDALKKMGRPLIHDMKAVPSTYHQCVKLPSPWGLIKIESDQQDAKDCYALSMK